MKNKEKRKKKKKKLFIVWERKNKEISGSKKERCSQTMIPINIKRSF
jgi:hypothetical protein